MSTRSESFREIKAMLAAKRIEAESRASGNDASTTAISALPSNVLVSSDTPSESMTLTTDAAIKGYTPTFVAMLPPWVRLDAVPSWFTRRAIGADGQPTPEIEATKVDRLANWHMLQELAGLR